MFIKIKERIFNLLFPLKAKYIRYYENHIEEVKKLKKKYEKKVNYDFEFDFSEVDDEANPPHFLKDLSDTERKNYVADLESIYSNKKFHDVAKYLINKYGNKEIGRAHV